jgi:hypothetical protein
MVDYTKIKSQISEIDTKLKNEVIISDKISIIESKKVKEFISENDCIEKRILCLNMYESVMEIVRKYNSYLPLLDKLTIEDLIELLYPNHLEKMISLNI